MGWPDLESLVFGEERAERVVEFGFDVFAAGDLVDVVSAVNAAEMSLETVVAIRDKVIAAYQDILRMPI